MLKIISFGIVETVGFGTILGKMLGMGADPDFSFEFISRVALVLLLLVVVIFIGFKIKGVWGAVITFFLYASFLLYINGLLPI
jgi:hypothetical protein